MPAGAKVCILKTNEGEPYGWVLHCPGCKHAHCYLVESYSRAHPFPNGNPRPFWDFNGDIFKPTFRASMLIAADLGDPPVPYVCHSFVTDGMIQFLDDCTHDLKGQTVEVPDF